MERPGSIPAPVEEAVAADAEHAPAARRPRRCSPGPPSSPARSCSSRSRPAAGIWVRGEVTLTLRIVFERREGATIARARRMVERIGAHVYTPAVLAVLVIDMTAKPSF